MPNSPKKIKRPWKPERKPFKREKTNYDFYNSSRWRKTSILYRDKNPLCEMDCKTNGIVTSAEMVDHIIPIKNGGDLYNFNNLQSGCHKCHNKKSGRESGKSRIKK